MEWALDISGAKFVGDVTFETIPGDKIRRDPATQILVRRQTLETRDWRALDFQKSAWDIVLGWFLSGSLFDSVVLAARTVGPTAKRDLSMIERLRREGVAEPD